MTKPEFWLQLVMFIMFGDLVRPQILFICIVLNLWGILVYALHTRKRLLEPFTYEVFRQHCIDAAGTEAVAKFDKLVGYVPREPAEIATKRSSSPT